VIALALLTPASPAFAGPGDTAAELRDCLTTCPPSTTISLTQDLDTGTAILEVGIDAHLDLAGHRLTSAGIRLAPGTTLTIADTATGGTLYTNAGSSGGAGIETTAATLRIVGGHVVALGSGGPGGRSGAGIGGADGGDTGTVEITGGEVYATGGYGSAGIGSGRGVASVTGSVTIGGGDVTAQGGDSAAGVGGGISSGMGTVSVTGGTVAATGGSGAPGIGGGYDGVGGTVRFTGGNTVAFGGSSGPGIGFVGWASPAPGVDLHIGQHATVTATGGSATAIGGHGATGSQFGRLEVAGTLHLPAGVLTLTDSDPAGPEVTVTVSGKILGASGDETTGAIIRGSGQIRNQGIIALEPVQVQVTVSGAAYYIEFDRQDGSTPTTIRLFAPRFDGGYRTIPTPPAGKGWNFEPDGTGGWLLGTTGFVGSGPIYAAAPGRIDTSTLPASATAGAGLDLGAIVVRDPAGRVISPVVTVTSDDPDDTVSGSILTATTVGTRILTASAAIAGITVTATQPLEVVAAVADELDLTVTHTSVDQGGSLTFAVDGVDAYGNPADMSGVVLASDVATDVIDGLTVTFPTASPHTITATVGAASTSVVIEVIPPPVPPVAAAGLAHSGTDAPWAAVVLALLLLSGGLLARRAWAPRGRTRLS